MITRQSIRALFIIFAPAALFVAALPWLNGMPDLIVQLTAAAATFWTIAVSLILAWKAQKRLDEWQRAGEEFSYVWGGLTGGGIVMVLLATEPLHGLAGTLFEQVQAGPALDQNLLIILLVTGACLVVLMQVLCTLLFHVIWRHRTLGPGE